MEPVHAAKPAAAGTLRFMPEVYRESQGPLPGQNRRCGQMALSSRNLEIKVRVEPEMLLDVQARLERQVCQPLVTLHQVDRYYAVDEGRLKLREIADIGEGRARIELIAYRRPTLNASRWSDYVVVPIPVPNHDALRDALDATHAVTAVVEKDRTIGILGKTRVHLDTVVNLGTFVELETVVAGQSDDNAREEHNQVIVALGLDRFPVIASSYQELMR
jgi:predicted adenylyl cyclase CyaB